MLYSWTESFYDENNRATISVGYRADGTISWMNEYSEDENGNFDQSKITINGHTPSDSGYFSNVWRTGFVKSCYGPLKKNSENLPLTLHDDELVNDIVQSIYLYDLEKPKVGSAPDYITVWFSEYYYPVMSSTEVEKWGVC